MQNYRHLKGYVMNDNATVYVIIRHGTLVETLGKQDKSKEKLSYDSIRIGSIYHGSILH